MPFRCTAASVESASIEAPDLLWALALLLGFVCLGLGIRRRQLARQVRNVAQHFQEQFGRRIRPKAVVEAEVVDPAQDGFLRYVRALTVTRKRVERERARRAAADAGLQELEERYGMAIRGADDALWEWDLRTDRSYFSARWKSLLGYADHELTDRVDEWWERVHPEDHETALVALKAHLEGGTPRLEIEHRVRHRDGGWRWLSVRATLVRDLAGEPSRVVGLVSDVTARRQIQDAVVEIADGLSKLSGGELLRDLVRTFASVVGVREAFICECSDFPTTRVRMLARWKAGEFARCVEFDLTGTACEDVICNGRTVFQPRGADERWPLEGQFERLSYLGIPCFDSTGRVIGHVACADDKPMREELPQQAILKIFAMRAALEIERDMLERELGGDVYPSRGAVKRAATGPE